MYEQTNQPTFQSTSASDHAFLERGFDPHRPIHTRGGEDVVLLTTNGPGPAPVIGIIFPFPGRHNEAGKLHRWNYHGKSYDAMSTAPRSLDLEKNTQRWFNWQQRELRTVSGLPVRIIAKDRHGERPYVGLVEYPDDRGRERIVMYYPNGKVRNDGKETSLDLINSYHITTERK